MNTSLRAWVWAFLVTASAVSSPVRSATSHLSFADVSGWSPFSVVRQTPDSVTYSLWAFARQSEMHTSSAGMAEVYHVNSWEGDFAARAEAGYRITDITLAGQFSGSLRPAQYGVTGGASNSLSFTFSAAGQTAKRAMRDLDGRQYFSIHIAPTDGTAPLQLSLDGIGGNWASSVWVDDGAGGGTWLPSFTDAGIDVLELTFALAPVPEPATVGMLLTGVAFVGWRTRRRAL